MKGLVAPVRMQGSDRAAVSIQANAFGRRSHVTAPTCDLVQTFCTPYAGFFVFWIILSPLNDPLPHSQKA